MDNSVFISYRRDISGYTALAVFQDLRAHDIDAFVDHKSIPAGQFEPVILSQIAARPYFVVILAPGSLKRCNESGDWLRREIEYAIDLDRIIVPLLTGDFDFKARNTKPYLTGKLANLSSYQAQKAPLEFFEAAMDKLRTQFLVPIDLLLTPVPASQQSTAEQKVEEASAEPTVTKQQLSAQEYFERANARPLEDLDGQITDYTEAIRLNPQFMFAYNNRGIAFSDRGDLDKAIADYTEAIRLDPQKAIIYNNRGAAFHNKGDLDKAIADYDEAIHLDPKDAQPYTNRAMGFRVKGDLDKAIADYDEAIHLDPKDADVHNSRGSAFAEKGDLDKAIADFDEAIRLNPQHPIALSNRKLALQRKMWIK